jgi:hypothetical protein
MKGIRRAGNVFVQSQELEKDRQMIGDWRRRSQRIELGGHALKQPARTYQARARRWLRRPGIQQPTEGFGITFVAALGQGSVEHRDVARRCPLAVGSHQPKVWRSQQLNAWKTGKA